MNEYTVKFTVNLTGQGSEKINRSALEKEFLFMFIISLLFFCCNVNSSMVKGRCFLKLTF